VKRLYCDESESHWFKFSRARHHSPRTLRVPGALSFWDRADEAFSQPGHSLSTSRHQTLQLAVAEHCRPPHGWLVPLSSTRRGPFGGGAHGHVGRPRPRAAAVRQDNAGADGRNRTGHAYFTFDDAATLAAAKANPTGFVDDLPERAILDEVQRVPHLFASLSLRLAGRADGDRATPPARAGRADGRFVRLHRATLRRRVPWPEPPSAPWSSVTSGSWLASPPWMPSRASWP